jgi:ATP adenylyltransferase
LRSERTGKCLFCTIVEEKEDRKRFVLHRGRHWYVVLNTYPYNSGHLMVVCNRHVESLTELESDEARELTELLARSEEALRKSYRPDGINVGANLGRSAGAGIEGHLHVHLVPRWHGDTNFMTSIGETRVVSEDLNEAYRRLAEHFR